MGLARVACRAQVGLSAPPVSVEVHLGAGLPVFSIVGLPAAAVRESKERVRAALTNSGFEFPAGRITVNLAPADLPKDGGRFDLAIALGILAASGQAPGERLDGHEFLGELGLNGALKGVCGVLPAVAAAGTACVIAPSDNRNELALAAGSGARCAESLAQVCGYLRGELLLTAPAHAPDVNLAAQGVLAGTHDAPADFDLSDVQGQAQAKRALLVAAAGGHGLLFVGPPGCGKSMLAQRLASVLPPLTDSEFLEVAGVASVSGQWARSGVMSRRRSMRAPHHTSSASAIIGGGPRAQPGEITLAHHGVLFLDELPEFDRRVLEALREPLESGVVSVSRANMRAEYPARFLLVAAMNPCPCGYFGDAERACRCTSQQIAQYRGRLSGPLLDRIDLRVGLRRVSQLRLPGRALASAMTGTAGNGVADRATGESRTAAERVAATRARQLRRGKCLNAHLTPRSIGRDELLVSAEAAALLEAVQHKMQWSARSMHSALRVSRTIADLGESTTIEQEHIAEAVQLRRAFD